MARTRARGFTLVELLVVITIIGMLMSLLLPAIQSAREAGRKSVCASNMRQVGIALAGFHDNKKGYPGYANVLNEKRASWVVMLLPYMERNDLYQIWQNNSAAGMPSGMEQMTGPTITNTTGAQRPNPWAFTRIDLLVCPSNPNSSSSPYPNPLSYVVNCGSDFTASDNAMIPVVPASGTHWAEDINSGVFFNNCRADWNSSTSPNYFPLANEFGSGPRINNDFISTNDGTSNTLMVSENLQAGNWATDAENPAGTVYANEYQIKQRTGFVWFVTGLQDNRDDPSLSASTARFFRDGMKINGYAKMISNVPMAYNAGATPPSGGLAYSRPSSAHPGGVNVVFCDGHTSFIAEDIPYHVYTQLMTPKQQSVSLNSAGLTPPFSTPPWVYTLNEADFR